MAGAADEIVAEQAGQEAEAGRRDSQSGSLAPPHYPDYSAVPQLPALDSSPRHSLAPETKEEGGDEGEELRKSSAVSANAVVTQVAPVAAATDKEEDLVLDPAKLKVESETS